MVYARKARAQESEPERFLAAFILRGRNHRSDLVRVSTLGSAAIDSSSDVVVRRPSLDGAICVGSAPIKGRVYLRVRSPGNRGPVNIVADHHGGARVP